MRICAHMKSTSYKACRSPEVYVSESREVIANAKED